MQSYLAVGRGSVNESVMSVIEYKGANWKNTTILKNKIKIETNIFLLRE